MLAELLFFKNYKLYRGKKYPFGINGLTDYVFLMSACASIRILDHLNDQVDKSIWFKIVLIIDTNKFNYNSEKI